MKKSLLGFVLAAAVACAACPARADYKYDYIDYEEMAALLQDLAEQAAAASENVYSLQTIGHSYLGNPVYAVKFSDSPETDDETEPDVVIDSGIHPREWLPVECTMQFVLYLFDAYYDAAHPDHAEVVQLVRDFEIWIIPMLNPDGRIRDDLSGGDPGAHWSDATYHPHDYAGWRTNVQEVDCPGRPDGRNVGINLNRNFSYKFWESSNCMSSEYAGSYPFEARESKVLKQFINNHMVSLVLHQHAPLQLVFSASRLEGLGAYLTREFDEIYETGMPDPQLALRNDLELMGLAARGDAAEIPEAYRAQPSDDGSLCGGSLITGQFFNWLWQEIDCELSPDDMSRRGIQNVFYESPFLENRYGEPGDGRLGQYARDDGSNNYHPSSGEIVEWFIQRSIQINKYIIKQSRYPFSPRNHGDMSRRPEAPDADVALVGAKISEDASGLPGAFTFDESDGRDLLAPGTRRITWNVQNNGSRARTVSGGIRICSVTDDPQCQSPVEQSFSRPDVPPEQIETFTYTHTFQPLKDYAVTLTTQESNSIGNDVKRFVFSTTEAASACPAALLLGYDPEMVEHVRAFRDDVLLSTPEGRAYVAMFYRHAPELLELMLRNSALRRRAATVLHEALPSLFAWKRGRRIVVPGDIGPKLLAVLDAVAHRARPALQAATRQLQQELRRGGFVSLGCSSTRQTGGRCARPDTGGQQ